MVLAFTEARFSLGEADKKQKTYALYLTISRKDISAIDKIVINEIVIYPHLKWGY